MPVDRPLLGTTNVRISMYGTTTTYVLSSISVVANRYLSYYLRVGDLPPRVGDLPLDFFLRVCTKKVMMYRKTGKMTVTFSSIIPVDTFIFM